MAAMASQAAFAAKSPDSRCASGPSLRSAKTCSMTAWPRCCSSAWASVNGELVKTAWQRQAGNSSPARPGPWGSGRGRGGPRRPPPRRGRRSPSGRRSSRWRRRRGRPQRTRRPGWRRRGRRRRSPREPHAGDHRGRQWRADRGSQRVQLPNQQRLAVDLRVPEPRALLWCQDSFLRGVDVHERQHISARQQGACPTRRARNSRPAFLRLPDVPQLDARRNESSVDGARTPANSVPIAPGRSRPMSSMLSASAAMLTTRQLTLRPGLAPQSPDRTCSAARSCSPALREGHHRDQPVARHEIRVIERDAHPRGSMGQSRSRGVLSCWAMGAYGITIIPVQRASFALPRLKPHLIHR